MTSETLSVRALNRATLARQMLLGREAVAPVDAIRRLLALQAQEGRPPFLALWSRVDGFDRDSLKAAIDNRALVRATLMRATLHLMTAADYIALRSTLQPALTAGREAVLRKRAEGLDVDKAVAMGRAFFAGAPSPFELFRDHLAAAEMGDDVRALAYAARLELPLVQVPSGGPWSFAAASASFVSAQTWLGRPIDPEPRVEELVRRYLAALGPATAADAQLWLGMRGLAPVLDGMRGELATFRDERKRELFDLQGAPRPDPDTPSPVRFLADFDNVLLGHADRTRVIADEYRKRIATPNLRVLAAFLVDGFAAGLWKIERKRGIAALILEPFAPLPAAVKDELAAEGEKLVAFAEPDAKAIDILFEN